VKHISPTHSAIACEHPNFASFSLPPSVSLPKDTINWIDRSKDKLACQMSSSSYVNQNAHITEVTIQIYKY
jgi:hypothetical protein